MQQISPVEDLMREHGLLHRILLIYQRIIDRLKADAMCAPVNVYQLSWNAADIVKRFIVEYHQQLEQDYVFPIVQKDEQYRELVDTLLTQHEAAKCLTDHTLAMLQSEFDHKRLSALLSDFIDMYEPHSAREDTVVFPAFHQMTPADAFSELGELFESIEEQKFGENGFGTILGQVEQIEQMLNIYDLDMFTAHCETAR